MPHALRRKRVPADAASQRSLGSITKHPPRRSQYALAALGATRELYTSEELRALWRHNGQAELLSAVAYTPAMRLSASQSSFAVLMSVSDASR